MKKEIIVFLGMLIVLGSVVYLFNMGDSGVGGNVILEHGDYSPERIVVPVKVHLVKEPRFDHFTTRRDGEDVSELFLEANRIWEQGGIYFTINEIVITEVNGRTIPKTLNGNATDLYLNNNFDRSQINLFFTHDLNGINGLALGVINTALVTDFTTVNDYRTTAHEFGHILGLGHVEGVNRLMARGVNGEELEGWEIDKARDNAIRLFD
jgi:hypothetical protein